MKNYMSTSELYERVVSSSLFANLLPAPKDNDFLVDASSINKLSSLIKGRGFRKIQQCYSNPLVNYGSIYVTCHANKIYILDLMTRRDKSTHYLFRRLSHYFYFTWPWKRIVCLLGPDGCGKTTLRNILQDVPRVKCIYYGDWGYILQPVYSFFLKKLKSPYNRIVFIGYLIENMLRFTLIWVYALLGFYVVLERQPGSKVPRVGSSSMVLFFHRVYYRFFQVGQPFLIDVSPEEILTRKKELTRLDIINHYTRLELLAGARCIKISNNSELLDDAVNTILEYFSIN